MTFDLICAKFLEFFFHLEDATHVFDTFSHASVALQVLMVVTENLLPIESIELENERLCLALRNYRNNMNFHEKFICELIIT